ncbi:hypothetical protein BDA96_02G136000 [Sorghum bicolor]|uniref:Bifunctional inhibitor/plant lipid transfer protein/seed storage helical domain-containing protein n=1 Tax=Sorghum bicolor TaxID=4558 RepID=A0A921RN92_SORBI|nr:hypothetical protein BDA96_02G136000 [Sorghum bicolor]
MAPSSNYTLIALLVAFAVVAPSLQHQSAAARDGGVAKLVTAPAPSANGEVVVLHPTASYEIPDLPLPRIIPCPPLFPKIPFIPCYNVAPPPPPPPRPKECWTTLVKSLVPPCSGFLTNNGGACESEAPSRKCCDGVKLFLSGDRSVYDPLCLCHVMNGDVSQLLPAAVDHTCALALVQACLDGVNPQPFSDLCNNDQSIKDEMPPMDLPEPPPPATGNTA